MDSYYSSGGWSDFKGAETTIEAALKLVLKHRFDFWEIVDIEKLEVVQSGSAYEPVPKKPRKRSKRSDSQT
jgi:hypothetical protein